MNGILLSSGILDLDLSKYDHQQSYYYVDDHIEVYGYVMRLSDSDTGIRLIRNIYDDIEILEYLNIIIEYYNKKLNYQINHRPGNVKWLPSWYLDFVSIRDKHLFICERDEKIVKILE